MAALSDKEDWQAMSMDDLLSAITGGSQEPGSGEQDQRASEPFAGLLGSLLSGAHSGDHPLDGPLGSLLGRTLQPGDDSIDGKGVADSSSSSGLLDGLAQVVTPMLGQLTGKLGLSSKVSQAIVGFVLGKLLIRSSGGAGGLGLTERGPDLDELLTRLGDEKGVDRDYLRSTSWPQELADKTGIDLETALEALQQVLALLAGETPKTSGNKPKGSGKKTAKKDRDKKPKSTTKKESTSTAKAKPKSTTKKESTSTAKAKPKSTTKKESTSADKAKPKTTTKKESTSADQAKPKATAKKESTSTAKAKPKIKRVNEHRQSQAQDYSQERVHEHRQSQAQDHNQERVHEHRQSQAQDYSQERIREYHHSRKGMSGHQVQTRASPRLGALLLRGSTTCLETLSIPLWRMQNLAQ